MTIKSLLLLVLFSSGLLNAQVIPGRWEKVDSLESGEYIVITVKFGDRIECAFKSSDSTTLTVTRRGSELAIPKTDVATIVQQKPRSNKPIWIGAALGSAIGVGSVVAIACSENGCNWDESVIGLAVVVGLIGAVPGALIGHLVTDKPPDEVLYHVP